MNVVITFFLYLYLMHTKINFNNTLKMFFRYAIHFTYSERKYKSCFDKNKCTTFLSEIQKSEIQTKLQENSHCLDFLECFRFHLIIK